MSAHRPRRTKAEQGAATRARFVAAGRRLFAEQGFAATSIEAVLAETGLTRGALYHHFADKRDLFRAVLVQVHQEVAAETAAAGARMDDAWEGLLAALAAYFDAVRRPDVLRIFYTEACSVIAYDEWSAIDREHGTAVIVRFLDAAVAAGYLPPRRQPLFALMLVGAIDYGLDWAVDPEAAHETPLAVRLDEVRGTFFDVLACLRVS